MDIVGAALRAAAQDTLLVGRGAMRGDDAFAAGAMARVHDRIQVAHAASSPATAHDVERLALAPLAHLESTFANLRPLEFVGTPDPRSGAFQLRAMVQDHTSAMAAQLRHLADALTEPR